jgi:hypothetical protein
MKPTPRILMLLLCLVPAYSRAQDDPCSKLLVPLTVRDTRGEVLHGLSAADLEVKVNGNAQQVENIHRETRPRRIVILLDASGSMKGVAKDIPWQKAIGSAQFLASLSEGRARLALLLFNTKIIEEIGFSGDNAAITKRLNELQKDQEFLNRRVQGATHLYDAMGRALQLLGEPISADVLYVVSDAGENGSHLIFPDIKRKLLETGVRVFLTRPEDPLLANRNRTPEEVSGPEDSSVLVEQSGGASMTLSPKEINFGFRTRPTPSLTDGVRMFYAGLFDNDVLELGGTPPNLKKRDLKITLSSPARDHLNGAQLSYPHQLYLCTQAKSASVVH